MRGPVLSIRLSRRALAVAALDDERLTIRDGRHLSSQTERALRAVENYLQRILEVTKPSAVLIDAPHDSGSSTSRFLEIAMAVFRRLQIQAELVALPDILSSYGIRAPRSRRELWRIVEPFWPELGELKSRAKPYILDAAAVALYGSVRQELGVPTPG